MMLPPLGLNCATAACVTSNKSEHIQIELFVEVLRRDLLERAKLVDARVVDQDVDRAELLDDGVDEGSDGIGIGHVGLDHDGFAAGLLDFVDDFFRAGLAARVIHRNGRALRRQAQAR